MIKSKPATRKEKIGIFPQKRSFIARKEEEENVPVHADIQGAIQVIPKDMREGLEYQISVFKSNLQIELEQEIYFLSRRNRRYFWTLLSSLFVLVCLTTAIFYWVFHSFAVSQKRMLDQRINEVQGFTGTEVARYASRMDSSLAALEQSVAKQLARRNSEIMSYLETLRGTTSLDSMAQHGSRAAFTEMLTLSSTVGKGEGAMPRQPAGRLGSPPSPVQKDLFNAKLRYAVLRSPAYSTRKEHAPFVLNNDTTNIDELSAPQLVKLMQDSSLSLEQVHAVMSRLWTVQPGEITVDLLLLLQRSDNLAASIATCSLLSHYYGPKADIYEFNKWIQFLKTKLQIQG
ncbi:MAG: hypothetical protein KGJ59_08435 [Bacteroidota bacterium]|nr:hypothetical protein [Bacteroidota bacterium]